MKSHSSHRSHGSETQTVNSDTLYPNNQQFLRTNRNEVRGAVFFTQQIASSPSCVKERTKKCCRFFDSLLYTARSRLHCEISSDCVVGTHEINHFEQQKVHSFTVGLTSTTTIRRDNTHHIVYSSIEGCTRYIHQQKLLEMAETTTTTSCHPS
jgi:hypothetical protein